MKKTIETHPVRLPDVLCVMTDRMNIGLIGAYGSDSGATKAFDRLAMESTLFDQYYVTSLDSEILYRGFWRGEEPALSQGERSVPGKKKRFFFRRPVAESPVDLISRYKKNGYRTILVTDSPEIAALPDVALFDQVRLLPGTSVSEPVAKVEETGIFALFAETVGVIFSKKEERAPIFVWTHLTGFGGTWDFPTPLREEFVEGEEDPSPYAGISPPAFDIPNKEGKGGRRMERDSIGDFADPSDAVSSVRTTFAAGMAVWDAALEGLVHLLKEGGFFENSLLVIGSTRGFPLGEHRRVGIPSSEEEKGDENDGLPTPLFYSEELHLPLLIHFPDHIAEGVRFQGICGPTDLYRTLLVPLGENLPEGEESEPLTLYDAAREETESIHSSLILVERDGTDRRTGTSGVITPEWFFIRRTFRKGGASPKGRIELYVKPDDRWDVNEVADRCEKEVRELTGILDSLSSSEAEREGERE